MQAKRPKTPALSDKTKILCFDLESNGLHGEVFAVGAVIMDVTDKILKQFTGRTKIVGRVDEFVEQTILPAVKDMSITHTSYKDLREAFWRWYIDVEPEVDYVLVSNGYPVEYRFLLKCQEENLEERYWQHPFPILDLSSLLLALGDLPEAKSKIIKEIKKSGNFVSHNPLDDAKITALAAFRAFRSSGRIT